MKTLNIKLLAFLIIFSSFVGFAQKNDLKKDMKSAFETFDKGKTFKDWLKGAEMMSALGHKYETEWLPNYWASYFYSQVARSYPKNDPPKNISQKDLLDLSQNNHHTAFNKVKDKSLVVRSDFHALQSLIYNFRTFQSSDEKVKKEFKEKAEEELKAAINANNNNPLVHVLVATQLVNRKDYRSVYAARQLLLESKKVYGKRTEPRHMSTHWNEEWVNYWISQTEKGIKVLTSESK